MPIDDLKKFLEDNQCKGEFTPYAELSPSRALTVYFKPDPDYSERLTELITVFRSLDTNEIVGCRIAKV